MIWMTPGDEDITEKHEQGAQPDGDSERLSQQGDAEEYGEYHVRCDDGACASRPDVLRGGEEHSARNANPEYPCDGYEKERPAEARPWVRKISPYNGDGPENGETDNGGEGRSGDGVYAADREASEDIP